MISDGRCEVKQVLSERKSDWTAAVDVNKHLERVKLLVHTFATFNEQPSYTSESMRPKI